MAGARDTKYTEIGRQIVNAAYRGQPSRLGAVAANGSSAGSAGVKVSAAVLRAAADGTAAECAGATADERRAESDNALEHGGSVEARFVGVPAAGHAVHLERPEAIARLLLDWLRDV